MLKNIYVSPRGMNTNDGTLDAPVQTLEKALHNAKEAVNKGYQTIHIYLRKGIYRLDHTLTIDGAFSAEDITLKISSYNKEEVIVCGSKLLNVHFEKFNDHLYVADTDLDLAFDTIFINHKQYNLARYPNFNKDIPIFNGYSQDCLNKERISTWKNPTGGYIHAIHKHLWGGYHYIINGKDTENNLLYEGGWQNNRQLGMHEQYRYVENIFEELDAPGEWFFDATSKKLYIYPYDTDDLNTSQIECVTLPHLIELRGSSANKISDITFENIIFKHTKRTFMQTKEPLLRSDWSIYRGGAILLENTSDCTITNCTFMDLGGNALFISGDNTRTTITSCLIQNIGANGISFVGHNNAVRSPLFEYEQRQSIQDIDLTPGPKSNHYPKDALVHDCLIFNTGTIEKQSAPIQISMSKNITIRHCSIYDVPRAGINISEGTFGGHIIEYCDVFDTVKETGDHGSFNSWGRDRYWGLEGINLNQLTDLGLEKLPYLDMTTKNIIRNNRFRCDKGWDIDLDDGSSNYEIYNNLCLNGGIKLREGFGRTCTNNIMVNNSIHVHVWYENSHDVIKNNIVFESFKPIGMPKIWGDYCDFNILHRSDRSSSHVESTHTLQAVSGKDEHSIVANCHFNDVSVGDYTVYNPFVLSYGFKNFEMDKFGVVSPHLVALAKTPQMPTLNNEPIAQDESLAYFEFEYLKLKNIDTLGEVSAYGTAEKNGVIILDIPPFHSFYQKGLKNKDVIIGVNDYAIHNFLDFKNMMDQIENRDNLKLTVLRNQVATTMG